MLRARARHRSVPEQSFWSDALGDAQNGLFWRCAPGRPDLLSPDGPPRFAGWTDGRHARDVRLLQLRAPDPRGWPAADGTLMVQERVPWKGAAR